MITHKLRLRGIVPRYYELDRLNSFDLVILDKLRHVTPSPDADEPRAESAEGAEP